MADEILTQQTWIILHGLVDFLVKKLCINCVKYVLLIVFTHRLHLHVLYHFKTVKYHKPLALTYYLLVSLTEVFVEFHE